MYNLYVHYKKMDQLEDTREKTAMKKYSQHKHLSIIELGIKQFVGARSIMAMNYQERINKFIKKVLSLYTIIIRSPISP